MTKQPKALKYIACVEGAERMSFYTLFYLLVVYATDTVARGGLGWSKPAALALISMFAMTSYTLPIFGGAIVDRYLGKFKGIVVGASLGIAGHLTMMMTGYSDYALYVALTLVALGTAVMKPTFPALLGNSYGKDDPRRVSGYTVYYAAINIGAALAGFTSGYLSLHFGYQIALASASVGLTAGLIMFFIGRKHYVFESAATGEEIVNVRAVFSPNFIRYFASAMVIFTVWCISYNVVNGGVLALYINSFTDRTIAGFNVPTTYFESLNSLVIIACAPIIARFIKFATPAKQLRAGMLVLLSSLGYFMFLIIQHQSNPGSLFNIYEIASFISLFSVSEILVSPAVISLVGEKAPASMQTLFQSIYLLALGLTALVAGSIGTLSLSSPVISFGGLAVVTALATYGAFRFAKK